MADLTTSYLDPNSPVYGPILAALDRLAPCTFAQVAAALGLNLNLVKWRLRQLRARGFAESFQAHVLSVSIWSPTDKSRVTPERPARAAPKKPEAYAALTRLIAERPGITVPEIVRTLGKPSTIIVRMIERLEGEGALVSAVGALDGASGRHKRCFLTDAEKAAALAEKEKHPFAYYAKPKDERRALEGRPKVW